MQLLKRYRILVLFSLTAFSCGQQSEQYYISDDLSKEQKKNLIAYFEQGKVLYINNCTTCHGIYQVGKENIPNFTTVQIETYRAKLALKDGQTHSFADSLSYDQIEQILRFLSFRKGKDSKN